MLTSHKGVLTRVQFVNGSLQFDAWQRSVSQRAFDVDGDGRTDFLGVNDDVAEYSYLHQDMAGGFVDKAWYGTLEVNDSRATFLRQKTGALPILAGVTATAGVDLFGGAARAVLPHLAPGNSEVDGSLELPVRWGGGSVLAWDQNGDGRDDLVVGDLEMPGATLVLVDDQGQMTKGAHFPEWPGVVSDAKVADFDEDGVPDVVASFVPPDPGVGNWPGEIMRTRWLRSTPSGIAFSTFDVKGQLLGVADFDDDGHVDVVVLRSVGSTSKQWLDIYRGDGAGGLSLALTVDSHMKPGDFGTPWVPNFICDYNGDGLPDLGTYFQGVYAFILNTSE